MIGPLSYLDIALIAVTLISGLLAMYRGLSRELLSIVSWAVAAGALFYVVIFQKDLAKELGAQVGLSETIARIGMAAIVFVVVLIAVHLITARISDAIVESRIGLIDRVFGFVFGVARGIVLVVIPYMFYIHFFPNADQQAPWVRTSLSLPLIQGTGNALDSMLKSILAMAQPSGDPS